MRSKIYFILTLVLMSMFILFSTGFFQTENGGKRDYTEAQTPVIKKFHIYGMAGSPVISVKAQNMNRLHSFEEKETDYSGPCNMGDTETVETTAGSNDILSIKVQLLGQSDNVIAEHTVEADEILHQFFLPNPSLVKKVRTTVTEPIKGKEAVQEQVYSPGPEITGVYKLSELEVTCGGFTHLFNQAHFASQKPDWSGQLNISGYNASMNINLLLDVPQQLQGCLGSSYVKDISGNFMLTMLNGVNHFQIAYTYENYTALVSFTFTLNETADVLTFNTESSTGQKYKLVFAK